MNSKNLSTGDLVWAKVKNFPPWPARIEDTVPPYLKPSKNKNSYCCFFFGTEEYGFVPDKQITPHSESVLNNMLKRKKKSVSYQKAIDNLIRFAVKKEDPNNLKMKMPKVPNDNFQTKGVQDSIRVGSAHKSLPKNFKRSLSDSDGECSSSSTPKSPKRQKDISDVLALCNSIETSVSSPSVSQSKKGGRVYKKGKRVSKKRFGFIGLGCMGKPIVKNLVEAGHDVTVWIRKLDRVHDILEGVKTAETPADLVFNCDIIYCCTSGPDASKEVVFGEHGVLKGLDKAEKLGQLGKCYVEMTSMDPGTSIEIGEAINSKRGLYMEAPLCGTNKNAEDSSLVIIASGDIRVFSQCESCFNAITKHAIYMTYHVGYAVKVAALLNTFSATIIAAVAEALVLAEKLNVPKVNLMDLLCVGPLNIDTIIRYIEMIKRNDFPNNELIQNMQQEVNVTLQMADNVSQPMPVTAACNEMFKRARCLGYSDKDPAAMYKTLVNDV